MYQLLTYITYIGLLNQAHAALWPARAWFLRIDLCRLSLCVCVCVCLRVCASILRLLITGGMMWGDMDPIRLVKQVL